MESGKLDEELSRMSEIADAITPNSIVLCNESFAATSEGEGSEIARQVVRALLESGIAVVFVTHLFDLANGFYLQELTAAPFLRAEQRHQDWVEPRRPAGPARSAWRSPDPMEPDRIQQQPAAACRQRLMPDDPAHGTRASGPSFAWLLALGLYVALAALILARALVPW